jgi:dihydrofolate reductase
MGCVERVSGRRPGLTLIKAGLVDEFQPFVYPVIVGGGTPFLPDLEETFALEPEPLGAAAVSLAQRISLR